MQKDNEIMALFGVKKPIAAKDVAIAFFPFMLGCLAGAYAQNGFIRLLLMFLSIVYFVISIIQVKFDLDVVECFLSGYKKSSYYLATKEEFGNLARDEGLMGEYKGYVLSRKLNVPHKVLYNVCLPMRNGNFQEIDTIIITRNMIYVVECKNRGGIFQGSYDQENWVQYIGSKQNITKNMYMQNQKHTMALDQFLLDRGIIQNGDNVCMNVVFSAGDMQLPTQNMPLDFIWGDTKTVKEFIEKKDEEFEDGTDNTYLMNKIYDVLVPYSLYTNAERKEMMVLRDLRSQSKELAVGEFNTQYIENGIAGVTNPGEIATVRWNKLYTQVEITQGTKRCWQTRTDIGNQTPISSNQISKGVDIERVNAFKHATSKNEKRLVINDLLFKIRVVVGILLVAPVLVTVIKMRFGI